MTDRREEKHDTARPHWQVVEEALESPRRRRRRKRRARHAVEQADAGLPTVYVSDALARHTADLLAGRRAGGSPPSTVFWLGFRLGGRACVTTLVVPEDDVREDAILASAVANDEIFSAVVGASLVYLGQARSRPPLTQQPSPTAGSDVDVRYDGALCVEMPRPVNGNGFALEDCLVSRQIAGERRQIAAHELAAHLRLLPAFKDLRRRRPHSP